jgi:hypothetical protein
MQRGNRPRVTTFEELSARWPCGRPLILDAPARVNFRYPTASLATDREEIEANAFAAAILMPERLVLESVRQLLTAGQHTPEKLALLLAEEYAVSTAAMGYCPSSTSASQPECKGRSSNRSGHRPMTAEQAARRCQSVVTILSDSL